MKELNIYSLLFQIIGLLAVVLFTAIFAKKMNHAVWLGGIWMFIVNIIAQIVIAGGGPGACIGSFGLPIMGMVFAAITYEWYNAKHKDK